MMPMRLHSRTIVDSDTLAWADSVMVGGHEHLAGNRTGGRHKFSVGPFRWSGPASIR
jgi:hypothetical protein